MADMSVPPEIVALIEQLSQELKQSEQLAVNGLNLVKSILSRFPDNARMIELFAVLTNLDFGQFKIFPRFKFPHLLIASE
jgi:hypothetical protein